MADTTPTRTPRQIADAYLDALVAHEPDLAASFGLNLDDDSQPDLSPEGFEAGAALARQALAELDAATGGTEPADPVEAACARLLRERLSAELACHEAGDHLRALSNIACPVHRVRTVFTIMPTLPELPGTFLTSQSIESYASVDSSTAFGSSGWTAVDSVNAPSDLNRPRIDWFTRM